MVEGTLLTSDYEKILDMLCKDFTTKRQILDTRKKILKLINREINITEEQLNNTFNVLVSTIDEGIPNKELFNVDSYSKLNKNLNLFYSFIITIGDDYFKDKGYSLLLSYFFYMTSQFVKNV